MTPRQRIINAFWHRGRKVFVPLTKQELSIKASVSFDEIRDNGDLFGRPLGGDRMGHAIGGMQIMYLTDESKALAHAD